jgi:hypothetical protein
VEQLAPDGAAIKAAHGVAKPAKWKTLGRGKHLLWGECQGSGANPYQVRVDLTDAACKCSCPSRKLPCKHALGLLLLLASGEANVPLAPPPEFVQEWVAGRANRSEAKETRTSGPTGPSAAEAQSRRVEKREARVETGLAQLEGWLSDVVAQGLAATRVQPPEFWSQMAARLVDAQAPGLARRVRELSEVALAGEHWQSQLLAGLSRLQLLIDAYHRMDNLPVPLAAEVRTLIGWTQAQQKLLERAGISDRWHVLGHRQSQEDKLRVQSTWLSGIESGRIALVLEFAAGAQPLSPALRIGQVVAAELVYYEGVPPLRAAVKQRIKDEPSRHVLPAGVDSKTLQTRFAALLAENPFVERWPVVLGPVKTSIQGARTHFTDVSGRRIAASPNFRHGWLLDSLAGGGALAVFGLWDGHLFDPVSVEHDGQLFSLAHIGELPGVARPGRDNAHRYDFPRAARWQDGGRQVQAEITERHSVHCRSDQCGQQRDGLGRSFR